MRKGTIGAILLHDATLTRFEVLEGGVVLLGFDGVSVYRRATEETEDIWLHRAELIIEGVTDLTVQGRGWTRKENDNYVLDDKITNSSGEEIHWIDLEHGGIREIELSIFSGARIQINGTRAVLRLSRRREWAGQWKLGQ